MNCQIPAKVVLADHIQPLLNRSCTSCHGPQAPSLASLPEDAASSLDVLQKAYARITHTDTRLAMPPASVRAVYPAFSDCETKILKAWIDQKSNVVVEQPTEPEPSTAIRLLNIRELNNTLKDVLGVTDYATSYLPKEALDPFDTNASREAIPQVVEGFSDLAYDLGVKVASDATLMGSFATCAKTQTGAGTKTCLTTFATALGERLYRRPLVQTEIDGVVNAGYALATEKAQFGLGVQYVVMGLLQSPSFMYRQEIGTGTGNIRKLSNFEIVSRLSYLVLGTAPSKELITRAKGAALTSDDVKALATQMMSDPRAMAQLQKFHELWLKYADPYVPSELKPAMVRESKALIDLILTSSDKRWTDLLTTNQTYVDETLAKHYGISGVTGTTPKWVSYQNPAQGGLLSHGSFLSYQARANFDTSPTKRGKYVVQTLLCRDIPPPPPDVNVDVTPDQNTTGCKAEAYASHANVGTRCFGCHSKFDPVGFGLEQLDGLGRFRTNEVDNPTCVINPQGSVENLGSFRGARELGGLLASSDEVTRCVVARYFEFGMGRKAGTLEQGQISRVHGTFKASGEKLKEMMLEFVGHPNFLLRKEQ